MKHRLARRVIASVMTALLVVGLIPMTFTGGGVKVSAADGMHTFDASKLEQAADKTAVEDGTLVENYFKVCGSVIKRTKSSTSTEIKSIELASKETGALEFTVTGTADLTVTMSSTGGSNESAVALRNTTTDEVVSNEENISVVTGTSATTLTYKNLTAGTYRIVSPDDEARNRGARIYTAVVDEQIPVVTTKYTFAASGLEQAADKTAVEDGTLIDNYFKVCGSVIKRTKSSTSTEIKSIELASKETGALEFTVTGTADLTVGMSSTGGSNESAVALRNMTTNEIVSNEENISVVTGTSTTTLTYKGLTAGTYRIVSPEDETRNRGARVYSALVTETSGGARPARADWAGVAAPFVKEVKQNGGNIEVSYDMLIDYDGADSVAVDMLGADGTIIETKTGTDSSKAIVFTPSASGSYSFKIVAKRADCDDKAGNTSEAFAFVLPLATPSIASATSVGNGSINVVWGAVAEATGYEVYAGDTLAGTTEGTEYTVTGLTIGQAYSFTVKAVRGDDRSDASTAVVATATAEQQQVWGFTRYGSSTDAANNGFEGNANDGSVTVYSENGKGKIVPNSTDGVAFYYTAVPTDMNFTLRANVHVDSWKLSNGQEGFGLMAADRLGTNGDSTMVWNNQYMALASKIEYLWNTETNSVDTTGDKYSMKLGLGVIAKTGVTKENLSKLENNDTATVQNDFKSVTTTLDTTAAKNGLGAGTYNIVGNAASAVDGTIAEITDFILEIQKNNTGYFITYYDADGNVLAQQKNYDPEALSKLDSENVYVGFFASRNARATFTDIKFSTISSSDDTAAEEKPITYVTPIVNVTSANVANTENYTFSMNANVDGTVDIALNGKVVSTGLTVKAGTTLDVPMVLTSESNNNIEAVFTPDPDYVPGDYMKLANTDTITVKLTVMRNNSYSALENIYVAPDGSSNGKGTKDSPVDIYTAVKYVKPGQTIVITEGTYLLDSTVRVERGVNGTADANIRMVADPAASTRPVFDFQGKCAGMILGGDYWYFNGFDCTHSQNAQKGIQVSGSHNVLDNINTYHNGNTGLQISRLYSSDTRELWPSYNLILNCTSYGNADAGYEDADGFAAKLTVGDGNVFDGCLAYNNADDGWDLYAKVETGSIGSVTIQNCVAYGNGYLEDGTDAGNGNGFKMGGDSMSGYHKLINSYAFNNKAKGIDSNSCPDIQVSTSISYNNESYNVALYTNNAANTDYSATGIISFKDSNVKSGLTIGEQFKPKGIQDTTKYLTETNYYWDGSKSANNAGTTVDVASWFKTLEFTGITRNADGTLNLNGFLETTDVVPEGIGARPTGTPSRTYTIKNDEDKSDDNGNTPSAPETPNGTAVGDSVISSSESTVTETAGMDGYVSNDVFESIIKNKKTLVVNVTDENGNVAATFTIDGSTFSTVPNSLFRLNVKFNDYAPAAEKAKEILAVEDKDMLVCTFDSVGYLNGKVSITVKADGFEAGTQLKLYYYNEELDTVMDKGQTVTVGEDGKVTFTVDHFSSYVLVNAGKALVTAPSTGFASSAAALMGVMLLAGGAAGICFFKKRK